jgi:MFS family permease
MRVIFILIAAVNLLILGPIFVGVPVLADTRLPEGAAAFGILVSAFGGGSLLGMGLAGILPKPGPRRLGPVMLIVTGMLGVGLALLGLVYSTTLAAMIGLIMGISYGYVLILFVTWLQNRTPTAMLGRIMSLLMFASMGLVPISMAVGGALIEINLTATLVGMGILMALLAVIAALNPAVRTMGVEPEKIGQS